MSEKISRVSGLDIFRILCCVGVLNYHVIDDVLGTGKLSHLLYYGSSFCVPGFFLLSGYLIGRKKEITLDYLDRKIVSTMGKLFGWVIFWVVIHFIRTQEVQDVFGGFTGGIVSGGLLPVSWFLFTYVLCMIMAYPLNKFKIKFKNVSDILAIILVIVLATGIGDVIVDTKPQSLWLHLYLGYFFVGMVLSDIDFSKIKKCIVIAICIILFAVTSWVYILNYTNGMPHQHYGTWFYSLWLFSIFIFALQIDITNEKLSAFISRIAENTFTVYLGHLPILLYLTAINPLLSLRAAIAMVIFLFVGLNLMAEIFRKLPVLRKIV